MTDIFAFTQSFDPDSLTKIKQFANWQPILEEELAKAQEKADAILQVAAKGNMNWKNPTGNLEDSLEAFVDNPYQSQMGTNVPYAWRREAGFSGMTDSLGRHFTNDPGQFYMQNTVDQEQYAVGAIFGQALDAALARLGVI